MTDTFILALVCLGLCVYVFRLQRKVRHLLFVIELLLEGATRAADGKLKFVRTANGVRAVPEGGE